MNVTKPIIFSLFQIRELLSKLYLIPIIKQGFVALSSSKAIVPPIAELLFENPSGETHNKYGYIKQQPYFVIKIASGFYDNSTLGIKSGQGVMLLFSQQTGELLAILLDEEELTDVRTAIASIITLKHMAPKNISAIGIIGTGIQAKLQLKYLHQVSDCKNVMIWIRNKENSIAFKDQFKGNCFLITVASTLEELTENCNVINVIIITATPSKEPLLKTHQIKKGTHITTIGSDTADKIKLDPKIIKKTDLVVSDSILQSKTRGEIFQDRKKGCLENSKLLKLGNLIQKPTLGRRNNEQITIADLTGVAVQDIMIAIAIFNNYKNK